MKALLDFLPLVAFFVAYKLAGVWAAAVTLMVAVALVYGGIWLYARKLEPSQWLTVGATFLLGSLTLLLNDEAYLQWKAPGVYGVLAVVFLASQLWGERPLVARMLGTALRLDRTGWHQLNLFWVAFFALSGLANAYVVLQHPSYWVDFKLFGSLAMTLGFLIIQGLWLVKKKALITDDTPSSTS